MQSSYTYTGSPHKAKPYGCTRPIVSLNVLGLMTIQFRDRAVQASKACEHSFSLTIICGSTFLMISRQLSKPAMYSGPSHAQRTFISNGWILRASLTPVPWRRVSWVFEFCSMASVIERPSIVWKVAGTQWLGIAPYALALSSATRSGTLLPNEAPMVVNEAIWTSHPRTMSS